MKIWAGRLVNAALMLIILGSLFILAAPGFFAVKAAVVLSGSMVPTLPVGSLAFTIGAKPTDIRVGDIIAFDFGKEAAMNTSHRVVEVIDGEDLLFRTKGDANDKADPQLVPAASICGRVIWHVPRLGRLLLNIMSYIRSRMGFIVFVAIPSVIIIGSALREIKRPYGKQRRSAVMIRRRKQWKT
ncbi:MAG: signal peptidase I [Chloroflexota bacterium]